LFASSHDEAGRRDLKIDKMFRPIFNTSGVTISAVRPLLETELRRLRRLTGHFLEVGGI